MRQLTGLLGQSLPVWSLAYFLLLLLVCLWQLFRFYPVFKTAKSKFKVALLHKDLKVKTSHIYSNLSDNSGMRSA